MQVIDYTTHHWWEELKGENIDLIFDCVGGPDAWTHASEVLKPKTGRFISLVGDNANPDHQLGVTDAVKAAGCASLTRAARVCRARLTKRRTQAHHEPQVLVAVWLHGVLFGART